MRFEGSEVFIRKDTETGDVILSSRPDSWAGFFRMVDETSVPEDFLKDRDVTPPNSPDPFE
jgi:antitoxin VapB